MQPSHSLFELTQKVLQRLWQRQDDMVDERKKALKAEIKAVKGELVEGSLKTKSDTLLQAYEERMLVAERKKAELQESLANCGRPVTDFDTTFRTAMAFLGSGLITTM